MFTIFFRTTLVLLTLSLITGSSECCAAQKLRFNRDIRPILSDRCFHCHGPDAETREADLRLDTAEAAYSALEFGTGSHVIKPGDPRQSEVFLRISSQDPSVKMPPPASKIELTSEEIQIIKQWIEQGAEYEGHWAFLPPQKHALPAVNNSAWIRNPVDTFILKQIEESNLSPNEPASREKLLRRVCFDLTGLPPTLEMLDRFLADSSDEAFEAIVDELLASEAYGERMAADWLDVARYSDTYGYQVDRDRFVWPWRDWVVRSFNVNLPYDQFITEQLAGDLLPNATDDQILATAFNRLHPQKVEGGSTPEEFRIEYIADRTQTFGTTFLGLTLECCRCHDHKFDPISQKEYYQLSAYFDNIDEAGLYSFFTPSVPTPTLLLTTPEQKAKISELKTAQTTAEQMLEAISKSRNEEFAKWKTELSSDALTQLNIAGEAAHLDFEKVDGRNTQVDGVVGKAAKLTGDDAINTEVGNFKRSQPFSVSLWLQTPDVKERAVVFHRSRAWTDAGSRGYQLLFEEGKLSASLIHFWPGNAIRIKTKSAVSINQWVHVVMAYDGSSLASGLKIYLDGELAETEVVRDQLTKQITGGGGDHIAIGERFRDRGFKNGLVDELRVYDRELSSLEVSTVRNRDLSQSDGAAFSDSDLREFYFRTVDPDYLAQLKVVEQKREELNQYLDGLSEIMVMREMQEKKPSYKLTRGAYDQRAEQVHAQTPAIFPASTEQKTQDRLSLAAWLTDPQHPLTSRVAVNRIWQMLFGQGLVRTPEDFGSQGALPTHPDLLDWLAADFVESVWDVKRLVKQIVMSATYRQSSRSSAEKMKADPENRLFARAPSYRLPAEMLRDNALAVSQLLVQKLGGPPAKPYEVEVSFKPTSRAKGEGLYRRSLYTYWKRTGPAPVMMTLDASKRDVCRVKREQTSSPLQAFVMLNGPQFVEASRALAERVIQLHKQDDSAALSTLFRLLTSRTPSEQEQKILLKLFASQHKLFEEQPEQALAYLTVGDQKRDESIAPARLAAMTTVANALFNFDECVIKR